MHFLCLLLLAAQTLPAAPGSILELSRKGHLLILDEVYLNHQGPFRMMIDTGNASSTLQTAVARRLGLKGTFELEHVTASSVRRVPAFLLDEVRTGSVVEKMVEVMITPEIPAGVDGVLGQSWLIRHDYLLDYHRRRLLLDPDEPITGVKLALRSADGRPSIAAAVDGRATELVLDSGAASLVLFGRSTQPRTTMLLTSTGSTPAGVGRVRVALGGTSARAMTAVRVSAEAQPGLLPLSGFSAVYISNREGVVVLGSRAGIPLAHARGSETPHTEPRP